MGELMSFFQVLFSKKIPLFFITLALWLLVGPSSAWAVPALGALQEVSQPDGSIISIARHGDEAFNYYVDAEGNLVQKDPESNAFRYVVRDSAGAFTLGDWVQPSGVSSLSANNEAPKTSAVPVSAADRSAYYELGGLTYMHPNYSAFKRVTPESLSDTSSQNSRALLSEDTDTTKESLPLLVIVVGFSDVPYQDSYDWSDMVYNGKYSVGEFWSEASNKTFTFSKAEENSAYTSSSGDESGQTDQADQADQADQLSQTDQPDQATSSEADQNEGLTEDALDEQGGTVTSSVRNTNTKDAINDGVVHVTLDSPHGNWGGVSDDETLGSFLQTLEEALQKAQSQNLVNFSEFDDDKDGTISNDELAVCFVIAGAEASFGYSSNTPSIWAHALDEANLDTGANKVKLNGYITMGESYYFQNPEISGDEGLKVKPNSTSTLCHELGHYLGLPDLYDTSSSSSGEWYMYDPNGLSLMAGGSWRMTSDEFSWENFENINFVPTRLDPYSRMCLGYIELDEITEDGNYTVFSQGSSEGYKAFQIKSPHDSNQLYLIELRQFSGFDLGLKGIYTLSGNAPAQNENGGIVVWHIDTEIWNTRGNTIDYTEETSDLYNTVNTPDHRPGCTIAYAEVPAEDGTYDLMNGAYWYPFLNRDVAPSLKEYREGVRQPFMYDFKGDKRDDRVDSGISLSFDNPSSSDTARISVSFNQVSITVLGGSQEGGEVTIRTLDAPEKEGSQTNDSQVSVPKGSSIELKATPHAGYHFTGWRENDTIVNTDSSWRLTANENHVFKALFEPHAFGQDWKTDDSQHWKECSCGEKDQIEAHSFFWVLDQEPSENQEGFKHEQCSVCGYQRSAVEIPALSDSEEQPLAGSSSKDNATSSSVEKSPQTSDANRVLLWVCAGIALAAAATMVVALKNIRNKR